MMTYLLVFIIGFLAAVVVEQIWPAVWGKTKIVGAVVVAAGVWLWDVMPGLGG